MNTKGAATLIISIIIVAAIAAGLAIYDMKTGNLSKSFYERAQEMDPIHVIHAGIWKPFETYSISMIVQNMRNATIISLTAELQGEKTMVFEYNNQPISEKNPLPPYSKATLAEGLEKTYEKGKNYEVVIKAVYSDNTTYTKIVSVPRDT